MVDKIYFDTSYWITLVCKKILNDEIDFSLLDVTNTSAIIYKKPTNTNILLFYIKKIISSLLSRLHNLIYNYRDEWGVGLIQKSIKELLGDNLDKPINSSDINWLKNEKNCFFADPFIGAIDSENFLLCEKFSFVKEIGSVSIAKIKDFEISKPVELLSDKTHFSFPFTINLDGELFIIPEEHEKKEINIYKYVNSNSSCIKIGNIIRGEQFVDPTLIFYNDLWWLFYSIHKNNENLFLWYSKNLFSGWTEHMLNPIKTDVRSARSAGPIFIHNGKLIRPAQDCSKEYGAKIVLNEIKLINKTNYFEKKISFINPIIDSKYFDGIHTISSIGNYTAIDGKKKVRKFRLSTL